MRGTLEAPCLVRCLARSVRYTAVSRATVPAARTRVGSRDARMRRPRPSPLAPRPSPPPLTPPPLTPPPQRRHRTALHRLFIASAPPLHVPQVSRGAGKAECTVTLSEENFLALASGKLQGMQAFVPGI